jgi:hypothetical protein
MGLSVQGAVQRPRVRSLPGDVEPRGSVGPHGGNGYTRPRNLDKIEADEVL